MLFVVCQNSHISSSVKSWRVWGNWVLNEPSWIENSWVTIGQNECESALASHGEHRLSFSLTLGIHYPPETRNTFWTRTALWLERALRSRSAAAVLKWMNEWISEGMNERTEWMNERWGKGRLWCYAVSPWHRPACFVLPSSPPAFWLAEKSQCCWKVLQSCGGYPPSPSPSQPLQFMNESWKNWMKNWVACERVVCAQPLLCSSGKICLALVLWMHLVCMLYTHNNIVQFTIFVCVILEKTATVCATVLLCKKYGFFVLDLVFWLYLAFLQFIKHREYFWLLNECEFE